MDILSAKSWEVTFTGEFGTTCKLQNVRYERYSLWIETLSHNPTIGEFVETQGNSAIYDYSVADYVVRYAVVFSSLNVHLLTLRHQLDEPKKKWAKFALLMDKAKNVAEMWGTVVVLIGAGMVVWGGILGLGAMFR